MALLDYSEKLISTCPVVVRRRVRFGECDPAGIVYTPVFSEYVVSAYQWLMATLLEGSMFAELKRLGFDTPIKGLTFEFRSALEMEQVFDMTCRIADIRTRTFQVDVMARTATEAPRDVFAARLTPITVARGERRAIELPAALHSRLQGYRARTEPVLAGQP